MLNISTEDCPNLKGLRETIEECVELGIKVADTREMERVIRNEYNKYLSELRDMYDIDNPNSSKQVIAAFKELASTTTPEIADVCQDEKTGKWSTKAENLDLLKSMGVPVAFTLARYRTLSNILSSINTMNNLKDSNGLVHPDISYGKTGRINYIEPALMNINKKVLWHMIAPRDDDSVLYSIDIKNQEPWILINMLDIESLRSMLDPERGLYESIFRAWFNRECTPEERAEFKMCWNALTYGSSKKNLEERCRYLDVDLVYTNFNNIPELKQYRKECTSKGFAGRTGCTTIFNTELKCDARRGMALARQHMDYPIQGSGVDILAFLNQNLADSVEKAGYENFIKPYFFRHDECIVQVGNALIDAIGEDAVEEFLKETFEHQIDNWVPFDVKIQKLEQNSSFEFNFDDEE